MSRISELNSYVNMSVHTKQLTEEFLGQFQVGLRQTVIIISFGLVYMYSNFRSLQIRTILTSEIVIRFLQGIVTQSVDFVIILLVF